MIQSFNQITEILKKMPHHGQVSFQTSWLQKDETWNKIRTWCQKESESTAFCIICNKSFSISNSGLNQDHDSKFQPNQNPPLPEIEKANQIK
jgi:ectoine hydroxylase-related dioxygenase (phytanoyl-CoA dioxygenase family)